MKEDHKICLAFRSSELPLLLKPLWNLIVLFQLDGEEEPDDDEWIEKDFYENAPIPVWNACIPEYARRCCFSSGF